MKRLSSSSFSLISTQCSKHKLHSTLFNTAKNGLGFQARSFSTHNNNSKANDPHPWVTVDPNKADTLPKPTGDSVFEAAHQLFVPTYDKPKMIFTHGKGSYLYDQKGKEYLDFTSGICVNSLGHSDSEWLSEVTKQAGKLTHVSNLFHTAPAIELAHTLISKSIFDKVFFTNSGTEANEAALKFARRYARKKFNGDGNPYFKKTEFVAFHHGFSGRSMGALSLTHKHKYRDPYQPLIPGVHFAEYNDLSSVEKVLNDNTCAVVVEPVQGEGGVTPATVPFLRGLRELCNKHNVLLIVDEIQCGLGRTGQLWAHSQAGIQPDMMTLAKPLANGLPIGATLVTNDVASTISPGEHGSTFAGGPLVTAVANSVVKRLSDPKFLEEVRKKGDYMLQKVKDLDPPGAKISEIRTVGGLFVGVEFKKPVKDMILAAQEKGVLFVNAGENVLRLVPPLIVSYEEIDRAISVIKECM
eukprot:TRINITY_DN3078_c0_g1_i1.p1 TRINITY_DN3078_c0_g1~~TRINITY_DN3078_c0_g1_i1.p1  ORF type:complete len:469 (-),score=94.05 TRINITY_DN3078_c0_g1_i1:58-1464(-)